MAVGRYGGLAGASPPNIRAAPTDCFTLERRKTRPSTTLLANYSSTAIPPYRHTAYLTGVASVSLCRDIRDRK